MLLLAALLLTAAAWLRSAEYDEQYTMFLTSGPARPAWPDTVFPAGDVVTVQSGHAALHDIVRDLRATDVHPPLYFFAVSIWRRIAGPGLFVARVLSVLCGVASIGLVGLIARRCAIHPPLAMLLTLGSYGFAYTNAIARGFAPAQVLTLGGVALLLHNRAVLAGVCLGAACCCNYLAVFAAIAAVLAMAAWPAAVAAIPFLAVDAWFFTAQHAARPGQFVPFELWPSLLRLAEYQTASVFGGLPLYVDGAGQTVVKLALGGLAILLLGQTVLTRGPASRLLLAAAIAPPIGLLLLGAVFNNTPIELRYLSFGLPFIALLAAGPIRRGRTSHAYSRITLRLVLITQVASIIGLLVAHRTMQPARAVAADAVRLGGDGIVLVPRGNDGVGIVGAFAIEAPASLPLLLVRSNQPIETAIAPYRRVVLAMLAQDRESVAAIATMRATFAQPGWRLIAAGSDVEVFERSPL